MNVKFYIPKDEVIPTSMRLLIDDNKHVYYERVDGEFTYDFSFIQNETVEEAIELAKELAAIMCNQSYDHGSEWRVTEIKEIEQDERYKIGVIIRVSFRVRDAG